MIMGQSSQARLRRGASIARGRTGAAMTTAARTARVAAPPRCLKGKLTYGEVKISGVEVSMSWLVVRLSA
jgi:hypothetical protein